MKEIPIKPIASLPPFYERSINLALPLVQHFEGFRSRPYLCPARIWTAGYGRVLRDDNGKALGNSFSYQEIAHRFGVVTKEQAIQWLRGDLMHSARCVGRLIRVYHTAAQRAALTSFVFNLGGGALRSSTLRRVINQEQPGKDIQRQWLRWVYAGGRPLSGLKNRRQAEWNLWSGLLSWSRQEQGDNNGP